jgi:glycosyltransferase involved in cell wall biosynthesis
MKDIGGSFMRAFSLAREIARRGHDVTLMASRKDPGLRSRISTQDKVRIIEPVDIFPSRVRHGGLSPMDTFFRAIHVSRSRYDLIHAFDHRPAVLLPTMIARSSHHTSFVSDWSDLWGREGIASLRSWWARPLFGLVDGWLEGNIRRYADGVTFTSHVLQGKAIEQGVDPAATLFVPPGSNIDLIRPMDKMEMRDSYSLPQESTIAVYIGFAPYDLQFLAQAIREILQRQSDAYVLVCGADLDLSREGIQDESLSRRYLSFGFLPYEKLAEVLGTADVLLLPYRSTSVNLGRFPNKFGDYLASGRPILTQDTGELGEAVKAHNVGVFGGDTPAEFAGAFQQLVSKPTLLQQLGENARELAVKEFSWREIGARVLDLYERISLKA